MKKVLALFITVAILSFFGCDEKEDVTSDAAFDQSETEGNIVISNFSNNALALYYNGECLKKLPNSSTDFIVWLPNPSDMTLDLQLYKYDDVAPDFLPNPDISMVYKRWNINVSDAKDIEKRVTWHITTNAVEKNSGSLIFNYVGGTDNQVDVYLNSQNGAKIITLKPGDQYDNIVGIEYGAYTMHFKYWYSDPNTPGSSDLIGWIESEVVSGFETDIWAVINDARQSYDLWIPHWENANVVPDTRGTIQITNQYFEPLRFYANGQLIENIMYLDGDTQASSILPSGTSVDFVVDGEVDGEKEYYLVAKPLNSGNTIAEATLYLSVSELAKWKIYLDGDGNVVSEVTDDE